MTTFQVTLFLDTAGALRAEGPNSTGSRRKLNNGDPIPHLTREDKITLADMILEDLETQKQKERDRIRARVSELHTTNVKYVASNHPGILKRVYPIEANHVNFSLKRTLKLNGYTNNEIAQMSRNGELVGLVPWRAPKKSVTPRAPREDNDLAKISAKLANAI